MEQLPAWYCFSPSVCSSLFGDDNVDNNSKSCCITHNTWQWKLDFHFLDTQLHREKFSRWQAREIGNILWNARYGWHSLIAAYGISPDKVVFIPHGVNISKGKAASIRHLTAMDHIESNDSIRVKNLLAKAGKIFCRSIPLLLWLSQVYVPKVPNYGSDHLSVIF